MNGLCEGLHLIVHRDDLIVCENCTGVHTRDGWMPRDEYERRFARA